MTKGYTKTEHGEFLTSYVQSFASADEFVKADILNHVPEKQRTAELKKLWIECNPKKEVKAEKPK
jgi:hypothetical protein